MTQTAAACLNGRTNTRREQSVLISQMDSSQQEQDKQEIELNMIVDKEEVKHPNTYSRPSNIVVTCDEDESEPHYTGEGQKCVLSISSTNRGNISKLFIRKLYLAKI